MGVEASSAHTIDLEATGFVVPSALHSLILELTPPILLRGGRRLRQRASSFTCHEAFGSKPGVKAADYYDSVYATSPEYAKPYPESIYYYMWSVVADRLIRAKALRVLDIGCGPGQFAEVLRDRGISDYRGIDFSATSVAQARMRCSAFEFQQSDLTQSSELKDDEYEYDSVTALEVLEHIEDDVSVVRRIRPGAQVLSTVPNFGDIAHVRVFSNPSEVEQRYGEFFSEFRVDSLRHIRPGHVLFLLEGRRLAHADPRLRLPA